MVSNYSSHFMRLILIILNDRSFAVEKLSMPFTGHFPDSYHVTTQSLLKRTPLPAYYVANVSFNNRQVLVRYKFYVIEAGYFFLKLPVVKNIFAFPRSNVKVDFCLFFSVFPCARCQLNYYTTRISVFTGIFESLGIICHCYQVF